MTDIRSVALFGASGDLGDAIIPACLAAGLNVTAVTREGSNKTFPAGVKAVTADYTSVESLKSALKNNDAVVSLVGHQGVQHQQRMIDAAAAAGVKYFIPSEFGHDTGDSRVSTLLPAFGQKNKDIEYLKTKEKDGMSWTQFITGLWLDWGLPLGLFDIDVKGRKAKIWDGGNTHFSTTNVGDIATAITCVLTNPSARASAKNTKIYIHSVETTQNEVLAACEEAMGCKFEVNNVDSETMFKDAQAKYAQGDHSVTKCLLTGISVSNRGICAFGEKAEKGNKLLLGSAKKTTVKETVQNMMAGKGPNANWTVS